ncbi:MAG: DNA-binding domain-containing protein [Pseudomonadales bacterium]|nr:DNA-binding domain-containing protein [Pseudomonadales bacterium]
MKLLDADVTYDEMLTDFVKVQLEQHEVYRSNHVGVHMDALQSHFPATQEVLGDEVFSALALVYGDYVTDSGWDINLYGAEFCQLLAAQALSVKSQNYDWQAIAWLANLEYCLLQLYYQDDKLRKDGQRVLDSVAVAMQTAAGESLALPWAIEAIRLLIKHHKWLRFKITGVDQSDSTGLQVVMLRSLSASGFSMEITLAPAAGLLQVLDSLDDD